MQHKENQLQPKQKSASKYKGNDTLIQIQRGGEIRQKADEVTQGATADEQELINKFVGTGFNWFGKNDDAEKRLKLIGKISNNRLYNKFMEHPIEFILYSKDPVAREFRKKHQGELNITNLKSQHPNPWE